MPDTTNQHSFWQRLCAIPRFGFIKSDDGKRIIKAEGLGSWIDRDEAMKVMDDAQVEVDALRTENADLRQQLDQAGQYCAQKDICRHLDWFENEILGNYDWLGCGSSSAIAAEDERDAWARWRELRAMIATDPVPPAPTITFRRGDRVRKKSGSAWQGIVVGEYSTSLTPEGYAVESEFHTGSVQIYPASALELVKE